MLPLVLNPAEMGDVAERGRLAWQVWGDEMIEFLCTIAGMVAGAAIVMSITSIKNNQDHEDLMKHIDSINSEKIRGIVTQLHSLSGQVLDEVSNHSVTLKSFSEQLTNTEALEPHKILDAVDKIIAANQQMQNDLENAQLKLAQQQEIIEQTTIQSKSDSLTGLASRGAVDEYLAELMETKSAGEIVGLLLIDIDHFKRFNDTYGHLTGDAVLTCFARSITQCAGLQTLPARYGGEEFVIVLRGNDESELLEHAAYIRQFVSEQLIYHEDLELTITASAGLCLVQPGDNLTIAYDRSAEGLYKAKESGRNRGLWLSEDGWKLFPAANTVPSVGDDSISIKLDESRPLEVQLAEVSASEKRMGRGESVSIDSEGSMVADQAPAFLDLATFVDKVNNHLQQLSQMDLPSAAVMVEVIINGEESDRRDSWQKVIDIIQTKLRGIDILCNFRPHTLCIFLPGCSAELSYERASVINQSLIKSFSDWGTNAVPEKIVVAVSSALEKDAVATILNRLESAVDEAHHCGSQEIAIVDGVSNQFIQL